VPGSQEAPDLKKEKKIWGVGTPADLKRKKNNHLFPCTLVDGLGSVGVKLGTAYFLP
jgi:hypothetical protein